MTERVHPEDSSHPSNGHAVLSCPDRDTLVALLSSTWPAASQLSDHIENCSRCRQTLDHLSDSGLLADYRPIIRKRAQALPVLAPPTRLEDLGSLGDLAIEKVIGRGGMGIVFCGRDLRLGREVAVKFLLPGSSPESEKRFIREARAVAGLNHENIVPIHHIGQNTAGQDYIVLPLIPGQTLRQRLQTSQLDPYETARIIWQMTDALAHAHAAELIHRDVKPSNILLDRVDQRAKITDFGLVRTINDATLTQADMLCGTPEYMSPEQATLGDQIDARSDIYSLGVTFYECLTGTTPFRGRPLEVIDQHRLAAPIPPSRLNRLVPVDLETICLKAMDKEAENRYQTMLAFGDDLQRFLAGQPILAKPATSFQKLRLWCRRNPRLTLALTSTVGSLLLGTIVSSVFWLQSSANARQSQRLADKLSVQQQQLQTALDASESQRSRAKHQFDELRKLANELLFEIYPQVEFLENSLAVRKAIITSALEYLDRLQQEAGNDLELQTELAAAYEKIGELFGVLGNSHLGDKQAGLSNYRKAQQLRQAAYDADPNDPASLESLAHNYYVVARTCWMADEIQDAEISFQRSLSLQRELVRLVPDSDKELNKLATILIDYANIPVWENQFEIATPLFDEAREILNVLILRNPENDQHHKTMARLLRAMSQVHSSLGNSEAGERTLLEAIEIGKQLALSNPDDVSIARSVWLTEFMLSEHYIRCKVLDKVIPACLATIDFPQRIVNKEPENAFISVDLANSYFNLARAFRLNDDFRNSIEQSRNAWDVMRKLAEAHPDDNEYQRNLAIFLTEIARSHLELHEYSQVVEPADQAIAILELAMKSESNSIVTKFDLAMVSRVAAKAYYQLGDRNQALESINTSIALFTEVRHTAPEQIDPQMLEALADEKEIYSRLPNR